MGEVNQEKIMRHRHPYENWYCSSCHSTTRHEVREATCLCLRCGVLKYPTRLQQPVNMPCQPDVVALNQQVRWA